METCNQENPATGALCEREEDHSGEHRATFEIEGAIGVELERWHS
jgi:hypothetical protein